MRALIWLYMTRFKAGIRNLYSKPGSAIFITLLFLFYGALFIISFLNRQQQPATAGMFTTHTAIMIGLGIIFFMTFLILIQKRKALFLEGDAYYLFSGPFNRSQIMRFLMLQSVVGSLLGSLFSIIMMVFVGQADFSLIFWLLAFIAFALINYFFTILYHYVYLLSIQNIRYKRIPLFVLIALIFIVVAIFMVPLSQHRYDFAAAGVSFINSSIFYAVPFFGWAKLLLLAYLNHDYIWMLLGMLLLVIANGLLYIAVSRYKGDFVEKAMQDAQEFTAVYKEIRAGKRSSFKDKKIHQVHLNFKRGAAAIYSKNMLLMRKTNSFITISDILIIAIYFAITMIFKLSFGFFVYLIAFWLFSVVQRADFMQDMKNYQIYLIPDKPFKKLLYVMMPIFLKLNVQVFVIILISKVGFALRMQSAIQYYILFVGYLCVFLSGTVLSMRIMKSRSSRLIENLVQMLLILVTAIPSLIVTVLLIISGISIQFDSFVIAIVSFVMNILISFAILYGCRSMMNGREISSE